MSSLIRNLTLDEVCEQYKLSEEEHKKIENSINEFMLSGKVPSQNPIAIIDIAPPGSGKTGLNGMGVKQFSNNNVVVINSDELKPFHPKADEIAKLYPKYYAKVTNLDSNPWTDNLFESAVNYKYNIIFEGTGRNLKLLQKMINQMSGYTIIVRGMAVNELNCLISIVERYESQVSQKGWGRLVSLTLFYKAYEEMLDTIDALEKSGTVDIVEVYSRGEDPTAPIKIYESNDKSKKFPNARYAVISGREEDRKKAIENFSVYNCNLEKLLSGKKLTEEEKEILEKIQQLYCEKKILYHQKTKE